MAKLLAPFKYVLLAILLAGCSEVRFKTPDDVLNAIKLSGPSVTINNGAEFTRSTQAQLQLSAKNATEMYITNNPTCEDGGEWEEYSETKWWTLEGSNQRTAVFARYKNEIGEITDCTLDDIIHDDIPPTIKWIQVAKKLNNNQKDAFSFEVNDNLSGVENVSCDTDNSPVSDCSLSSARVQTNEGPNQIVIMAMDRAGNLATPIHYDWMVDRTGPKIRWMKRTPQYSNNKNPSFSVDAEDSSGVESIDWKYGNGSFREKGNEYQLRISNEGNKSVSVKAKDKLGNESKVINHRWVADFTPPTLKWIKKQKTVTNSINARFQFETNDKYSPTEAFCRKNSENFVSCEEEYIFKNLNDGAQSTQVYAKDLAGNTSTSISHQWLVDTVKPDITLNGNHKTMNNLTTLNISYSFSDDSSGLLNWSCQLDYVSWDCDQANGQKDLGKLKLGSHSMRLSAMDEAGNEQVLNLPFNVNQATKQINKSINIENRGEVDVLFVIDNSLSMAREQKEMGSRFSSFLQILFDLSWQVAITTTDVSNTRNEGTDGQLIEFEKDQYFLDNSLPFDDANKLFAENIRRRERGSNSEQGIAATFRSIERRNQDSHKDFFRRNSHLEVVLVSDEDESGDDDINQPRNLINKVNSSMGNGKKFRFHSIVARSIDEDCTDVWEHKAGKTYENLSQMTGGLVGDICADNYTDQLTELGENIRSQLSRFQLDCSPWDTNNDGMPDIKVIFDRDADPIDYWVEAKTLIFEEAPPIGKHKIQYHCPVK